MLTVATAEMIRPDYVSWRKFGSYIPTNERQTLVKKQRFQAYVLQVHVGQPLKEFPKPENWRSQEQHKWVLGSEAQKQDKGFSAMQYFVVRLD